MITLVDHGLACLLPLQGALDRLGMPACRAATPAEVASEGPLLLLASGPFETMAARLKRLGWWQDLPQLVAEGHPLLGLDTGMHLLTEGSEASPLDSGLGLIPGIVRRLGPSVKVPHLGWAPVARHREHPALPDPRGAWLHFAHSYALEPSRDTLYTAFHGRPYSVAELRGHVAGVQARLERSGAVGLVLLQNLLAWMGELPPALAPGADQ